MKVLGLSGGPDLLEEDHISFPYVDGYWHDAAAVALLDGEVIAAFEEERLNRIKHTNKFPMSALRACLEVAGWTMSDVDAIAVYFTEEYWNRVLGEMMIHDSGYRVASARSLILKRLEAACGRSVSAEKLSFIPHHWAHALSAWRCSGFDSSLVLTLDGAGDDEAGVLFEATDHDLRQLLSIPIEHSLGRIYLYMTRYLGYSQFDEYKIMGLAAFGDPRRYENELAIVRLLPEGRYEVDWSFAQRLRAIVPPRRRGDPLTMLHKDLAAAAQEALEKVTSHILEWAQAATGRRHLCLAGGVAHNCMMNGRILAAQRFQEVFVQPASHDAGCALGAAFAVEKERGRVREYRRVTHVFWGTENTKASTQAALARWSDFVSTEELPDVESHVAELLATGEIVGWVQGRAEFGPRALGHRSLLADPRPAGNRDRINVLIKKRETFRPFAPVVKAEVASRFFAIPGDSAQLSFMSFAIPVVKEWQSTLSATTHVDGTARLQTVNFSQEPKLWTLLDRFERLTGIPILLNTSFNVGSEPIVDSVEDAIVCLLTTDLEVLIIGDTLVTKLPVDRGQFRGLVPTIPAGARAVRAAMSDAKDGHLVPQYRVEQSGPLRRQSTVSRDTFDLLCRADGRQSIEQLLAEERMPSAVQNEVLTEILGLWTERMLILSTRKKHGTPLSRFPGLPTLARADSGNDHQSVQ